MTTEQKNDESAGVSSAVSKPHPVSPLKPAHFVIFCAAGFAIVVISTYAFISLIEGDNTYQPVLVAEFSGTGDGRTGQFEVDDAWEIRWKHTGHIEKIEWRTDKGEGSMMIDMHRKPIWEQGGVNWPYGGVYHIDVTAEGDWKLQIFQFKN